MEQARAAAPHADAQLDARLCEGAGGDVKCAFQRHEGDQFYWRHGGGQRFVQYRSFYINGAVYVPSAESEFRHSAQIVQITWSRPG
eukprot:SAG25_NODE_43_length_19261_cov_111.931218_6_plen_86_part_00